MTTESEAIKLMRTLAVLADLVMLEGDKPRIEIVFREGKPKPMPRQILFLRRLINLL